MKFKLIFIVFPIAMLLTACNYDLRNKPQQQADDMEVCRKANMGAYLTKQKEIGCSPKLSEYINF